MLEVWNEIKVELEQENIRPISPDADSMTEITKILNDRAAAVSATQVGHLEGLGVERRLEIVTPWVARLGFRYPAISHNLSLFYQVKEEYSVHEAHL